MFHNVFMNVIGVIINISVYNIYDVIGDHKNLLINTWTWSIQELEASLNGDLTIQTYLGTIQSVWGLNTGPRMLLAMANTHWII